MNHHLSKPEQEWFAARPPICKCKTKCDLKYDIGLGHFYECPNLECQTTKHWPRSRWHLRAAGANLSTGRVSKLAYY